MLYCLFSLLLVNRVFQLQNKAKIHDSIGKTLLACAPAPYLVQDLVRHVKARLRLVAQMLRVERRKCRVAPFGNRKHAAERRMVAEIGG